MEIKDINSWSLNLKIPFLFLVRKINKSIVLGGGCFWCIEAVYNEIDGVISAISGYAGGSVKNPTYKQVTTGRTGHAEVVEVTFDVNKIPLEQILEIFFEMHNPITLNRQGNDIGTQYRSIILYKNQDDEKIITEAIKKAQKHWLVPIVTEVAKLEAFYKAEDYHQNYFKNNPNNGYCRVIINPKIEKLKKHVLPKLELI